MIGALQAEGGRVKAAENLAHDKPLATVAALTDKRELLRLQIDHKK